MNLNLAPNQNATQWMDEMEAGKAGLLTKMMVRQPLIGEGECRLVLQQNTKSSTERRAAVTGAAAFCASELAVGAVSNSSGCSQQIWNLTDCSQAGTENVIDKYGLDQR